MATCLDSVVDSATLLAWDKLQIVPDEADSTKVNGFATKAISGAVSDFWNDINVRLRSYANQSQAYFKGIIGEKSYSQDKNYTGTYLGVVFRSKGKKDTKLYLNRIGLILNESKSVTVSLYKGPYDGDNVESVETFSVNTTSGSLSWSDALDNKVYDLYEDGCAINYYLFIEPTTERPKDTKLYCGCGGRKGQEYNESRKYAEVYGVIGDDLTLMNDWNRSSSANGFVLDVEFKCDDENMICLNYAEQTNATRTITEAIKYKAGANFIQQVLDNPDVERLMLISREHMYGKRNHFEKEYGDRIEWLSSEGLNLDLNDCFTCKGTMRTVMA